MGLVVHHLQLSKHASRVCVFVKSSHPSFFERERGGGIEREGEREIYIYIDIDIDIDIEREGEAFCKSASLGTR